MASSNNTSDDEFINPFQPFDLVIPLPVRFWLYLILDSLSILCSIFVLYNLLFDRALRRTLNNHVIIVLLFVGLIYELTTVPLMLRYYSMGHTWILTTSFAHFWTLIDYGSYTTELVGFAWATIERHILIFHHQWVSTKRKRFFVHYLPLALIVIYCYTYYFVVILSPFCETINFTQPMNGVPISCISFTPIMEKYDTICHQIIPTFTVAISSISLFIRILWQKTRLNRSIHWRRQRRMTIQLLSISILYLLFNFPRAIIQICAVSGFTTYLITKLISHLIFFSVQLIFFFPFICFGMLPALEKRLKKIFFCRNQLRAIVPVSLPTNRMQLKRTDQI